jgi:hypothetical protein
MSSTARPHVRRALALACGLLVLALPFGAFACSSADGSTASPAGDDDLPRDQGSGSVSTGFEKADVLGRADYERVSLTPEAAKTGAAGLEVRPTASDAYVRLGSDALGKDHPYWTFRAWMRVVAWTPTESVDLFTVRNLATRNNFDLFVAAPNHDLRWDIFRENSEATGEPIQLEQWHLVEARGSFATSTFTADVRIDGVDQPSVTSPGQQPSAVKDFILGSLGTAKTHRIQFDDVSVQVADSPRPFLGPPRAGDQP